jgi:hypothetical protein
MVLTFTLRASPARRADGWARTARRGDRMQYRVGIIDGFHLLGQVERLREECC